MESAFGDSVGAEVGDSVGAEVGDWVNSVSTLESAFGDSVGAEVNDSVGAEVGGTVGAEALSALSSFGLRRHTRTPTQPIRRSDVRVCIGGRPRDWTRARAGTVRGGTHRRPVCGAAAEVHSSVFLDDAVDRAGGEPQGSG